MKLKWGLLEECWHHSIRFVSEKLSYLKSQFDVLCVLYGQVNCTSTCNPSTNVVRREWGFYLLPFDGNFKISFLCSESVLRWKWNTLFSILCYTYCTVLYCTLTSALSSRIKIITILLFIIHSQKKERKSSQIDCIFN